MTTLKQQCPVYVFLLFVFVGVGIFILLLSVTNIIGGLVWLVLWPTFLWVYLHFFPAISLFIGYGRVDDVQPTAQRPTPTSVRLYTTLACPFGSASFREIVGADSSCPAPLYRPVAPTHFQPVSPSRTLNRPFGPLVKSRLRALQGQMGFELEIVDVS